MNTENHFKGYFGNCTRFADVYESRHKGVHSVLLTEILSSDSVDKIETVFSHDIDAIRQMANDFTSSADAPWPETGDLVNSIGLIFVLGETTVDIYKQNPQIESNRLMSYGFDSTSKAHDFLTIAFSYLGDERFKSMEKTGDAYMEAFNYFLLIATQTAAQDDRDHEEMLLDGRVPDAEDLAARTDEINVLAAQAVEKASLSPKKKAPVVFSVRIDPDLRDEFVRACNERRYPTADVIRSLMAAFVNTLSDQPPSIMAGYE